MSELPLGNIVFDLRFIEIDGRPEITVHVHGAVGNQRVMPEVVSFSQGDVIERATGCINTRVLATWLRAMHAADQGLHGLRRME